MNLSITIILVLLVLSLFFLLRNLSKLITGFGLLLEKFVEINQEFYEGQKNIAKKDREILDGVVKQTAELSIIRRYSTQISIASNTITETIKNLRESQKSIKETSEELKVSKTIATSLASVSNNIKILDSVVKDLKESIENLKKEKH
jgi:hypothetical protein